MSKNKFIYYKAVDKILENNYFFGFTAKRNKETNRILYTYRSIRYPNVLINVLTMRLDPTKIQSEKIVLGIKFNDIEIGGWNDFINELKHVYKYNKKKEFQKFNRSKRLDYDKVYTKIRFSSGDREKNFST